ARARNVRDFPRYWRIPRSKVPSRNITSNPLFDERKVKPFDVGSEPLRGVCRHRSPGTGSGVLLSSGCGGRGDTRPSGLRRQCPLDGPRLAEDDEQVGTCGAVGLGTALLPVLQRARVEAVPRGEGGLREAALAADRSDLVGSERYAARSEEHTSELQSRGHLVCRLLLEKKKKNRDAKTR